MKAASIKLFSELGMFEIINIFYFILILKIFPLFFLTEHPTAFFSMGMSLSRVQKNQYATYAEAIYSPGVYMSNACNGKQ